tara:strand:+ start:733 stop:939 length:207 start_codon:yes stop_codon:yes gene_type:complete
MSDKDDSVEYLEYHIENSFSEIMGDYIIEDITWETIGGETRAIAYLVDPSNKCSSNLVVLFPPLDQDK